jgi:hypothetical protein
VVEKCQALLPLSLPNTSHANIDGIKQKVQLQGHSDEVVVAAPFDDLNVGSEDAGLVFVDTAPNFQHNVLQSNDNNNHINFGTDADMRQQHQQQNDEDLGDQSQQLQCVARQQKKETWFEENEMPTIPSDTIRVFQAALNKDLMDTDNAMTSAPRFPASAKSAIVLTAANDVTTPVVVVLDDDSAVKDDDIRDNESVVILDSKHFGSDSPLNSSPMRKSKYERAESNVSVHSDGNSSSAVNKRKLPERKAVNSSVSLLGPDEPMMGSEFEELDEKFRLRLGKVLKLGKPREKDEKDGKILE